MLRQTREQSKKVTFKTKIYQMKISYEGDMIVICKNCGFCVAPLTCASRYMNIDIEDYRFGNYFIAMKRNEFQSIKIDHENEIFNTEEPFLYMFLKPVLCGYCQERLGLYIATANIKQTDWLLNRVVLNMEMLQIDARRSLLMDSTINLLHGKLMRIQAEKEDEKVFYKQEMYKEAQHQEKSNVIQHQKYIENAILHNTKPIFAENKNRGATAAKIISFLGFYDRNTQRIEKEGKKIIEKCEDLKWKIMESYESLQKNKIQVLKMKKAAKFPGSSKILERQ